MAEEFYTRPIFCVRDVSASSDYYCEKLGFEVAWSFPPDKPIIAQVGRNGLDLVLDSESVIPTAARPSVVSMTLHEAEKLGALHDDFDARGASISAAPHEVSWQKDVYQFVVSDPDGNLLVFWGDQPG